MVSSRKIIPMKRSAVLCLAAAGWLSGQTWERWPDPQSLPGPHPGFDLTLARPDNFYPSVAGMDFLPDGKLVLVTLVEGTAYKGSGKGARVGQGKGKVYLLEGVDNPDRSRITVKEFGAEFMNPLGIKVVQGRIFVVHQHGITELTDANGDGRVDAQKILSTFPEATVEGNCCTWVHGLVHKDGFFYSVTSRSFPVNGGKVQRVSLADGSRTFVGTGLRHPNGIGLGPDGEIYIADQQGEWRPSSPLYRFRPNLQYGHPLTAASVKPNLYLPHGEAANSPSEPLPAETGPFKGQMILGDTRFGNIHRVFLEKIGGETQGALFHFSGGVESGVNRMLWGADGSLYLGELGAEGHFSWRLGETFHGLQRLKPNGKPVFEMLNIRSRAEGFLLEFTQPVDTLKAKSPGCFSAASWEYVPTEQYGGPKVNPATHAVTEVRISADGRKVFLRLNGLRAGRILHISHRDDLLSQTGLKPWIRQTWYTLNALGPSFTAADLQVPTGLERRLGDQAGRPPVLAAGPGKVFRVTGGGRHRLTLRDARGTLLAQWHGNGPATYDLGRWQGGLLLWTLRHAGGVSAGKATP